MDVKKQHWQLPTMSTNNLVDFNQKFEDEQVDQKPEMQNDAKKIDTLTQTCCIKIEVASEIYSDGGNLHFKKEVDCAQMPMNDIPTKLPKLENIASDSDTVSQTCFIKTESSDKNLFDHGNFYLEKEVDCAQMSVNDIPGVNNLYDGSVTEFKQRKEEEKATDCSDTEAMHSRITSLSEKFLCELCGTDFTQARSLMVHMSVYHGQDQQTLLTNISSGIEKTEFCNDFSDGNCSNADSHLHKTVIYSKTKNSYTCSVCDKRFSHLVILKTLQGINTEQKLYKCFECKIDLSGKLEGHQSIHTKDKPYMSADFKKATNNFSNLQIHHQINKGKKPYKCTECNKTFTHIYMLKHHKCVHTSEQQYKCTNSGKAIRKSGALKSHQRIHTEKKPYKCKDCGKAFTQSSHLNRHQGIHTGKKPYKCKDCRKAFRQFCDLKVHLSIHIGDKPYTCTNCGKAFSSLKYLKVHLKIHTGEKQYKCTDCGKAYIHPSSLKYHLRMHTNDKPYKCTHCGKAFIRTYNLKRHQRIHTR